MNLGLEYWGWGGELRMWLEPAAEARSHSALQVRVQHSCLILRTMESHQRLLCKTRDTMPSMPPRSKTLGKSR